jgi:hypothetical protein
VVLEPVRGCSEDQLGSEGVWRRADAVEPVRGYEGRRMW